MGIVWDGRSGPLYFDRRRPVEAVTCSNLRGELGRGFTSCHSPRAPSPPHTHPLSFLLPRLLLCLSCLLLPPAASSSSSSSSASAFSHAACQRADVRWHLHRPLQKA